MGNVTVTALNGERMAQMEVFILSYSLSLISLSGLSITRIRYSYSSFSRFSIVEKSSKGSDSWKTPWRKSKAKMKKTSYHFLSQGTTYSMEEHSPFTISPIGEISLNGDIRVETLPYYRLEITVVDKDGRAEQTVYVLSVDEHNDTVGITVEGEKRKR